MKKFLGSNETKYRLLRTILQGVIGVLIANADLLVSAWSFTPEVKAFIVALVMAILSPIMSELGADRKEKEFNESLKNEVKDMGKGDENE